MGSSNLMQYENFTENNLYYLNTLYWLFIYIAVTFLYFIISVKSLHMDKMFQATVKSLKLGFKWALTWKVLRPKFLKTSPKFLPQTIDNKLTLVSNRLPTSILTLYKYFCR